MLEQVLKIVIPEQLHEFSKLTPGKDPYHFSSWDIDKITGETILRYWFWSRDRRRERRKRVFIREVESLFKTAVDTGEITRRDFEECCPRTNRDGGCGFAVIIAILGHFNTVHSSKRGVYGVADRGKVQAIIEC